MAVGDEAKKEWSITTEPVLTRALKPASLEALAAAAQIELKSTQEMHTMCLIIRL